MTAVKKLIKAFHDPDLYSFKSKVTLLLFSRKGYDIFESILFCFIAVPNSRLAFRITDKSFFKNVHYSINIRLSLFVVVHHRAS